MKGITLFSHSVRLVIDNLGDAFRLSIVPYILIIAAQVHTFSIGRALQDATDIDRLMSFSFVNLILSLASVVASLWIAVAWHRFVLLEEQNDGWVPPFNGRVMWGYFGWSLVIGILIALIAGGFALLVGTVIGPALGGILAAGIGAIIFFRLGLVLPAYAVGRKLSFSEAVNATKGETGTVLVLGFLAIVANILISLPTLLSGNPFSPISLIFSLVLGWFALIIGISLLTTLYGHFVEGRSVD